MKIDRFSLKKPKPFLINIYVFVTVLSLALAAVGTTKDNTMPGIIERLELIQNSALMSEIAISSVALVIITCLGILSIIGYAYFIFLVIVSSKNLKDTTKQNDTQSKT